MTEDQQLLRQYTINGSKDALEEIIRRYQNLVYSSALRQVRDTHLAEDIAQAVFLVLAEKARSMHPQSTLGGWLFLVTRRAALHAMRQRQTQNRHERAAARAEQAPDAPQENWEEISAVLDATIAELSSVDRNAVILRYFQDKPYEEIGAQLGLSSDAARKRVARALDRLRGRLSGRGVTVGSVALAAAISAHGVQSAPAAILSLSSASAPSIAKGVIQMMGWAKTKLVVAMCVLAAFLIGAGALLSNSLSAQATPAPAPPGTPAPAPVADAAPTNTLFSAKAGGTADAAPGPEHIISYDVNESPGNPTNAKGNWALATMRNGKTHVIESSSGVKCEIDDKGIRTVTDLHIFERIEFDDRSKLAVIYPAAIFPQSDPSNNPPPVMSDAKYTAIVKNLATDVGPETLDGRVTEKYTYSKRGGQMGNIGTSDIDDTIWVDPATNQLVKILENAQFAPAHFNSNTEYSNFQIDPKLPPNYLGVDPPADYKIITPPNWPSPQKHFTDDPAQTTADALAKFADDNAGTLPPDLASVSTYVRMTSKDVLETGMDDPDHPQAGYSGSAAGKPKEKMWIARLNLGRALTDLPKGDWAYLGANKTRGDASTLIFWCQTPAGYKGIYGDMTVKDLAGPGPTAEPSGN